MRPTVAPGAGTDAPAPPPEPRPPEPRPPERQLERLTSAEVAVARVHTLLVPLGATEQHGPHLPIGTDTVIASEWAAAAAARLESVLVAPTLPFGSSGEHQSFAGTLSIGHDALVAVLIELARSAAHDFNRVVFVSGHAGNVQALQAAVAQLRHEGHDAHFVVPVIPRADAHAGHTETSLMAHLDAAAVRHDLAAPGATAPLAELIDELRSGGVASVSDNGVLGDPTGASAADGAAYFEQLVAALTSSLG